MAPTFQIQLTAAQFGRLMLQAESEGFPLNEKAGTLPETQGVRVSYSVLRATNGDATVIFAVSQKPFFVPTSLIENAIRERMGIA